MKSRSLGLVVLLVSVLVLGGCGAITKPGAPDQSFDIDKDIQDLENEFKKKNVTIVGFYANPTLENRDKFISARLTLINIQYIKFIKRFAVEKAQLDTAADVLVIGLNLAGTLVGAASTKGILAAIAGGTGASRTSINKNFFQEKTVPVLVTAMNAERKEALVPIFKGISKSLDDYPFARALSDLHVYYQAGTFIGALQAIQKDSGAKEEKADKEIANLAIAGPVPAGVHQRAKSASNFVWDLVEQNEVRKLRSLANALGVPEDKDALDGILDKITVARTAEDMEVIEQAIAVIKGE